MRKYLFSVVLTSMLLFSCALNTYAQDLSVYNQFYFNPFLYNPAFVGSRGGTEVNSVFRQQWIGIDDAPIAGTFTLQHAGKSNVRLGLTVTHESVVILQRNSALLTAGYKLPLGYEQSLTFGISAGVGRYGLDLSQVDRSDPALANSLNSTLYADGNFGFMYELKALKVGFAVNNIFDANPYSQENFNNLKFSNLESLVGSVSYRFQGGNSALAFEPYLLYKSSGADFRQAEAAGVFYYQEKIWLGGAYRYESNPALFAGFNLFQNLRVSYAFEFPPGDLNATRAGSHELMFSYNFGSRKKPEVISQQQVEPPIAIKVAKIDEEKIAEQKAEKAPQLAKEKEQQHPIDSIAALNAKAAKKVTAVEDLHPPQDSLVAEVDRPGKEVEENKLANIVEEIDGVPLLSKGYYVVTGVFNYRKNAENFIKDSRAKGFQFNLAINPENNYYYVYKMRTGNLLEARYTQSVYAKIKSFSDVWIYKGE